MAEKREDKRGRRPFIKLRLSDRPDALRAEMILMRWQDMRQASQNMTNAIRLYDALRNGDVSLLYEMFPTLANAHFGQGAKPFTPPAQPARTGSRVLHQEPDEGTAIDDMLDMF